MNLQLKFLLASFTLFFFHFLNSQSSNTILNLHDGSKIVGRLIPDTSNKEVYKVRIVTGDTLQSQTGRYLKKGCLMKSRFLINRDFITKKGL